MRSIAISAPLESIPVDFFGDPDGCWEFEQLAREAGFDQAWGQLSIGALSQPYAGFPEGAAVVMLSTAQLCSIVLVDCTGGRASPGFGSQAVENQSFERSVAA